MAINCYTCGIIELRISCRSAVAAESISAGTCHGCDNPVRVHLADSLVSYVSNKQIAISIHRNTARPIKISFFGGATIQQFILAMFVGMVTGTYSSISVAVPLLVVWEKGEIPAFFRRVFRRPAAA